jgi:hypothetical protein
MIVLSSLFDDRIVLFILDRIKCIDELFQLTEGKIFLNERLDQSVLDQCMSFWILGNDRAYNCIKTIKEHQFCLEILSIMAFSGNASHSGMSEG